MIHILVDDYVFFTWKISKYNLRRALSINMLLYSNFIKNGILYIAIVARVSGFRILHKKFECDEIREVRLCLFCKAHVWLIIQKTKL